MEAGIVLTILALFFLLLFMNSNSEPLSNEELIELKKQVDEGEAKLKRIEQLNKQWDILIKKRSLALKEPTLYNYRKIDSEIELVKDQLKIILQLK